MFKTTLFIALASVSLSYAAEMAKPATKPVEVKPAATKTAETAPATPVAPAATNAAK